LMFFLGLFLLPFYPLLKRIQKMGEKIKFSEKVVVVTTDGDNRKRIFTN
jgi:hypothetical protein